MGRYIDRHECITYISEESLSTEHLRYGIDISVYEIVACEKSQKQSSWEHPGMGVYEVI